MLAAHIESGADVTIAYNEQSLPKTFLESEDVNKDYYYSFDLEDGRVKEINVNPTTGVHNLSLNIFVIERELLIKLVKDAFDHGLTHFTRDVLWPKKGELNIQGYKYTGYVARICSINSYFDENMKLLDDANLDALFGANPIYTKIRDDNPTRYISGSKVKNVMVADGCVIEGEVENSILFRGVKVEKGAKVKNCILMQDSVIEAGADVEYLITDKNVTISAEKELKGTDSRARTPDSQPKRSFILSICLPFNFLKNCIAGQLCSGVIAFTAGNKFFYIVVKRFIYSSVKSRYSLIYIVCRIKLCQKGLAKLYAHRISPALLNVI